MNSAQKTFNLVGEITQSDSASSDGSFPIAGTDSFDTPCFSAGTIRPGTFSAGSFILGESIALEVETSKSILTFLGTLSPSGSGAVLGNYAVSGGAVTIAALQSCRLRENGIIEAVFNPEPGGTDGPSAASQDDSSSN